MDMSKLIILKRLDYLSVINGRSRGSAIFRKNSINVRRKKYAWRAELNVYSAKS